MSCFARVGGKAIFLALLLVSGCTPAIASSQYAVATAEPTPYSLYLPIVAGGSPLTVLWEANDVLGLEQFKGPSFENFCPEYSISNSDGQKAVIDVDGSPAIELLSNPNRRPGIVVNVLSHRDVWGEEELTKQLLEDRVYGRDWIAWGEFKKGTEPDIQNNAINLQLVDEHREYLVLIQWILNPYDDNYGWMTLRTSNGDERIHYIGDDSGWHLWELSAGYDAGAEGKTIESLTIDGQKHEPNIPMPVGPTKPWQFSFALLVELTNQWTACSPEWTYTGSMYYRNMGVGYYE